MTIRIPPSGSNETSRVWTIDFRETAPALSNATMYVNDPRSAVFGGLSVGVPGEVKGLAEAHRRWGSLPWSTLVQPSVDLASGWTVGVELGRRIEVYSHCERRYDIYLTCYICLVAIQIYYAQTGVEGYIRPWW